MFHLERREQPALRHIDTVRSTALLHPFGVLRNLFLLRLLGQDSDAHKCENVEAN